MAVVNAAPQSYQAAAASYGRTNHQAPMYLDWKQTDPQQQRRSEQEKPRPEQDTLDDAIRRMQAALTNDQCQKDIQIILEDLEKERLELLRQFDARREATSIQTDQEAHAAAADFWWQKVVARACHFATKRYEFPDCQHVMVIPCYHVRAFGICGKCSRGRIGASCNVQSATEQREQALQMLAMHRICATQ